MPTFGVLYNTPGLVNSTGAAVLLHPGVYDSALSIVTLYGAAIVERSVYETGLSKVTIYGTTVSE